MKEEYNSARVYPLQLRKVAIGAGLFLLLLLAAILAKPPVLSALLSDTWGHGATPTERDMGLQTSYTFERLTPEPAVLEESAKSMERLKQRQAEHPPLPSPEYENSNR